MNWYNISKYTHRSLNYMEEKKVYQFVCTVCGHVVEYDKPELPDDFICPVCGVGKDLFVPKND